MNVVHVVATGQRRGAEVFAGDLVQALAPSGIDQRVVILRGDRSYVSYGAPVTLLARNGGRLPGLRVDYRVLTSLRERLSAWKPDIIQVHGGEPLKYAVLSANGGLGRVVYRRIGPAPREITRGARRLAHGHLMRRAARIVAVDDALRLEAIGMFRVPPAQVVTIPNGIDLRRLRPSSERDVIRTALGLPADAVVLLSVGALTPEKDPLGQVRITLPVLRALPDTFLLLAGDGPLRDQVREAARREAGDGRIRLLGPRGDVADLLQASDVVLLASRSEGMPGCLIEAGVAGRPAVAYALPGVANVVVDGVTGLLAPPGDERALSDRLEALARDGDARAKMGVAARDRGLLFFDIRPIAERYLAVYREVGE